MRSAQYELAADLARIEEELSPALEARLGDCLLDFLAAVLAGIQTAPGRFVARVYAPEGERGVAFALAYAAELSEFSHGSNLSAGHVGSTTLPAALAATRRRVPEGHLTAAVLAGYEAFSRVGSAFMPALERWGSVQTGFVGSLGAASAAARIRGLDPDGIASVLGTAAYLTPLTPVEGYLSGANSAEAAAATDVGIRAAELADAGVRGSVHLVDDLYRRIVDAPPPPAFRGVMLDGALGIDHLYFKPFPSCRFTHGAIQAALEARTHGLAPDEVAEVEVAVTPRAAAFCGGLPERIPARYLERQFSVRYMTALALLTGRVTPTEVLETPPGIDEEALEWARARVRLLASDELVQHGNICPARLTFHLAAGGTRDYAVLRPWGSPETPLSHAQLREKFEQAAAPILRQRDAEAWEELAMALAWNEIGARIRELLATRA